MADYRDITNIKIGLTPENLYTLKKEDRMYIKETEDISKFFKPSALNSELKNIKDRLYEKKKNLGFEDFIYIAFQIIEKLVNKEQNLTYITGIKYISDLICYFIGKNNISSKTYFYNKEKNIFIEAYSINRKDKIHYFVFQKNDKGKYLFQEVPKIYIEALLASHIAIHGCNSKPTFPSR